MTGKVTAGKIGLALLGILLALLLAEAGLRLGGLFLSLKRDVKDQKQVAAESEYRILCLGESTTWEQWPPLLERELNSAGTGVQFAVIDKGSVGTYTGVILSKLHGYLDTFNPHMVVVMMGINDGKWIWKNPTAYVDTPSHRISLFFQNLRLNKIATYIKDGLGSRAKRRPSSSAAAKKSAASPANPQAHLGSAKTYQLMGQMEEAASAYRAAIKSDPQNPLSYCAYGDMYRENGERDKAAAIYREGIKAVPSAQMPYSRLGTLYSDYEEKEIALGIFKEGIKAAPNQHWLYKDLGDIYFAVRDYSRAEAAYQTAVRIEPGDPDSYIKLGYLYRKTGDREKLEKACAAIESSPEAWAHFEAAKLLSGQDEKEKSFERGLVAMSAREFAGQQLARPSHPPPGTMRNYQELRDIVLNRGIRLVCMQYPMRDARALKDYLGTDKDIIYVENKNNFVDALKSHELMDLFTDLFAGDFGHCTEFGNRLIAKNLAETILREVFGKKVR